MALVVAGIGCGLPAAFAAARVLDGQLFGVQAADPLPFLLVSTFLASVGLVATTIPARRAMRVHPAEALRGD